VPLTVWFVAALIAHVGGDYEATVGWLRSPFTMTLTILLLIAMFWHVALGLEVVIEDYIHNELVKVGTIAAVYFGSFALAVAGIVASVRIIAGAPIPSSG
jgi:succinate dehydrogenase / fumarate reductase membrane anchor subunit